MSVFTHDREAWQNPDQPVSSSNPPVVWANIDRVIIHYTAADDLIDGDVGEDWDGIPQYLRNIQNGYVTGRGYSIGYNGVVDQRGVSWEARGATFKNAANKGDKTWHQHHNDYPDPARHNCNTHTFSILVLVDSIDSASPDAVTEIARLVTWVKSLAPPGVLVWGHKDVDRTGCPGVGLYWQVQNDKFVIEEAIVEATVLRFAKERVLDTRDLGGKTAARGQVLTLDGPLGAVGVKVNVTVTDADGPGFVTAYPAGTSRPDTSDVNYLGGAPVANQIDIPLKDGQYSLFVLSPAHVVVDQVAGWYN